MRRVVITGMGIVNSLGNSVPQVCEALRCGRSGVEFVAERQALGFNSSLAGTIKNFEAPTLSKAQRRMMGDGVLLAVSAALEAVADAGLTEDLLRNDRTGVIIGCSANMRDVFQQCNLMYAARKRLPAMSIARAMGSSVSANLSVLFGTRGQSMTVAAACASSATAIGLATQSIRTRQLDRVVCGGMQESSWEIDCHFDALRVFANRPRDPAGASRPFDKDRNGLVPSCGAGILILEDYEQALARGAKLYAEIIGYGANSDGYDMTTASGTGGRKCMQLALADAGIEATRVEYINAHATSTPVGDAVEARSIAEVFGEEPFVSSTKSMTGHEVAAAGSNELIATVLMMQHGFIAPTINLHTVDEDCRGIRILANEAADTSFDVALSNSFGFGGVNVSLIIKRLSA